MRYNDTNNGYNNNLICIKKTGKMKGSAMICTGETIEEVEEMIKNDPYVKNKVWESWTIYPYKE